jgi:nicotinamidase-related amidase
MSTDRRMLEPGRQGVAAESTLRDKPLPATAVHICVDMQRLFAPGTEWGLAWMPRVLPQIVRICELGPGRTIFTRFIPARRPGEGQGVWRGYYRRWASMTLEAIGEDMVELMPELAVFAPPAETLDKPVYSPWWAADLHRGLRSRNCDTLVVSGGETDMCVLATVLGAVDLGYRTVLVQDALCSSSDESHEAMLELFGNRYGQHVEVATTAEVVELWRGQRE